MPKARNALAYARALERVSVGPGRLTVSAGHSPLTQDQQDQQGLEPPVPEQLQMIRPVCRSCYVLPGGREAEWDTDGTTGLEAQIKRDGMLAGYMPQIDDPADFSEPPTIDAIARTAYDQPGAGLLA